MPKTGLDEFKDVLKDFRELGSLAVKGTVALPLVNLWAKFGPPPAAAVSVLTSALEFLAVIWVFQFWHNAVTERLNTRMKAAAILFCAALAVSGILLAQFTAHPASGRDAVVIGAQLRPDVQPLITRTYTPLDALRDAEYDPERVWTQVSITLVHSSLIVLWLVTFISASVFLSVFIVLRKRATPSRRGVRTGVAKKSPAA